MATSRRPDVREYSPPHHEVNHPRQSEVLILSQLERDFGNNVADIVLAWESQGGAVADFSREGGYGTALTPDLARAIEFEISLAITDAAEMCGLDAQTRQVLEKHLRAIADTATKDGLMKSFFDRARPGSQMVVSNRSLQDAANFPVSFAALEGAIDECVKRMIGSEDVVDDLAKIFWSLGAHYRSDEFRTDIYDAKVAYLRSLMEDPDCQQAAEAIFAVAHPGISLKEVLAKKRAINQQRVEAVLDSASRRPRPHSGNGRRIVLTASTAAVASTAVVSPAAASPASSLPTIPNLSSAPRIEGFTIPIDVKTAAKAAKDLTKPLGEVAINLPEGALAADTSVALHVVGVTPAQLELPAIEIDTSANIPANETKHVTRETTVGGDDKDIAETIRVGGIDAAASAIADKEKNPGKSLEKENFILSKKLKLEIEAYRVAVGNLSPQSSERQRSEIILARFLAGINNLSTLKQIDQEKYQELSGGFGADFSPLTGIVQQQIFEQFNTVEFDKWKGLKGDDRDTIIAMMAYLKLSTTPENEIKGMLKEIADNDTPGETYIPDGVDAEKEITNLDVIELAAKSHDWTEDKKMFYLAANELGLDIVMMSGLGGNAGIESAGYDMTIQEMGLSDAVINKRMADNPGLPRYAMWGKGYFQWTFGRHVTLANRATAQGVSLNAHTLANARLQLDFAIEEMKKRQPREGTGQYQTEWEMFQDLSEKGDVAELVWQIQWNFERPYHEQPQQARIDAGNKVFNQLTSAKKKLEEAKKKAQEKPQPTPPPVTEQPPASDVINPGTGETLTNMDCAPGTANLGLIPTSEHPNGVRLCAILTLPSSSEESRPGSPFYVEGANGSAIIETQFSKNLKDMVDHAARDGITLGATSSFRTNEHQRALWEEALKKYGSPEAARKWVAHPYDETHKGSMHEKANAVDLTFGTPNSSENCVWYESACTLPNDQVYKWLVANAHKYGFVQYSNEFWHWQADSSLAV